MSTATEREEMIDRLRDEAGHLLLRRIVDREDWISEAVLDLAAGKQQAWTPGQWTVLLTELRHTPGRLADWLDLNT